MFQVARPGVIHERELTAVASLRFSSITVSTTDSSEPTNSTRHGVANGRVVDTDSRGWKQKAPVSSSTVSVLPQYEPLTLASVINR